MPNMSLGGHTPTVNPGPMPLIRKRKPTATVDTYGGGTYFSWPAIIAGQKYVLPWNYMEAADFAAFETMYLADVPVTFVPNDGSGKSYIVNILDLDGALHLVNAADVNGFRKDVRLTLLIMSEVA